MPTKHATLELLVDGYFREAQKLLSNDRIIPSSINIIAFKYCQVTYWYYKLHSNTIWIVLNSSDQETLTKAANAKQDTVQIQDGETLTFTDSGNAKNDSIAVINGPAEAYSPCIVNPGSGTIKAGFCTPLGSNYADKNFPDPSVIIPTILDIDGNVGYDASDTKQKIYPIKYGFTESDHWKDMV